MKYAPAVVVLLGFLFCAERYGCQALVGDERGLIPYGSYHGGDVDSVNLKNGNLTIRIPLFSLPQRGKLSLSYSLILNSQAFTRTQFCDPPDWENGECYWQYIQSAPIGPILILDQAVNLQQEFEPIPSLPLPDPGCDQGPCTAAFIPAPKNSIVDATGASHALLYDSSNWPLLYAIDGSGYAYQTAFTTQNFSPWFGNPEDPNLSCSYPDNAAMLLGVIYTPDGVSHTFQDACVPSVEDPITHRIADSSYPIRMQDRSGNTITYSTWTTNDGYAFPGAVTDSINRAIPDFYQLSYDASVSSRCPNLGISNQPVTYSKTWYVPGPSGGQAAYTFCMTYVVYNTLFGGGIAGMLQTMSGEHYDPQAIGLSMEIQSVVLPNGTYWGFIYDSAGAITTEQVDGFQYPDPTVTPIAYGNIAKLILPTGGSIDYSYSQYDACSNPAYISNYISSRTINDLNGNSARWKYNYDKTLGYVSDNGNATYLPTITTVSDPNLNDTVHTFTNPQDLSYLCAFRIETSLQRYSGSQSQNNILKSEATSYANMSVASIYGESVSYNEEPTSSVQHLAGGGSTNLSYGYPSLVILTRPYCYYENNRSCPAELGSSQIAVSFNRPNNVTATLSDGSFSNTTITGYKYLTNQAYISANLLSLVDNEKVTDNIKNKVASQTTYNYDENNGSPQGVFGNLTSTSQWVDTGGADVVQSTVFNQYGMPSMQIDANQHQTSISYLCSGIFPYQITNSINQTTTYDYDCNTGKIKKVQDQNDVALQRQGTQYTYNAFGDLQRVQYPDGGTLAVDYHGYSVPLHITTTQASSPNPTLVRDTYYDGMARTTKTTVSNGATVIKTYDLVGNVLSVTNPYYDGVGYPDGVTSYTYDALGRMTLQCQPDNGSAPGNCSQGNSYLQWNYVGDTVDYYDESRHHWQRTYDPQGRLTKVIEPDAANTPSLETDYMYNALNNLSEIDQWGGAYGSSGEQVRNFYYDSIGRLYSANNAESEHITYNYLTGGAPCSGDPSLPCSKTDARGVSTYYYYDALNRLQSKKYGDQSSPTACYQYDSTSVANGIGRLAYSWTQRAGTSCSSTPASGSYLSLKSIMAYDPMGRPTGITEQTCAGTRCIVSTPYTLALQYDQSGNVIGLTNSVGANGAPLTLSTVFDAAARPCLATSNWNMPNSSNVATVPRNLFLTDPTDGYVAAGGLQNWYLGSNVATASTDCNAQPSAPVNVQQLYSNRLWVNSIVATKHP